MAGTRGCEPLRAGSSPAPLIVRMSRYARCNRVGRSSKEEHEKFLAKYSSGTPGRWPEGSRNFAVAGSIPAGSPNLHNNGARVVAAGLSTLVQRYPGSQGKPAGPTHPRASSHHLSVTGGEPSSTSRSTSRLASGVSSRRSANRFPIPRRCPIPRVVSHGPWTNRRDWTGS